MSLSALFAFLHNPLGYVAGILTTPMFMFGAILSTALIFFAVIWFFEQRKAWGSEILEGVTGVKDWRTRLNSLTEGFVALGAEPLLARAASKSDDPIATQLSGQTLSLYLQLKDYYLSLSYAYNCGARAIQQAEAMFKTHGPLKLVTIRRAGQLADQGLEIKEVSPDRYLKFVSPERNAPKPPTYQLGYVFRVCDKLNAEIAIGLKRIADTGPQVTARLAAADKALAASTERYNALVSSGLSYGPYHQRQAAIAKVRLQVSSNYDCDPLGALQVCADLDRHIASLAKELEDVRLVLVKLAAADQNTAAVVTQYDALHTAGVAYLPFDERHTAIAAKRAQVTATLQEDLPRAQQGCVDLEKAIAALTLELQQAKQHLATVSHGAVLLDDSKRRVAKVRATALTCDWWNDDGERVCWTLSNADSDPDSQLAQCETLLAQARQSLANGQLQSVAGEYNQALAALAQADKMVKGLLEAKAAVDEQVPHVRAELAAIHGQLVGITGGDSTNEMAQLVERTCSAVESRIKEVRHLYTQQLFPEALNLLTGTAGSEYGLPIAKLLAQAKELLKLLQQAVQVAGTLASKPA